MCEFIGWCGLFSADWIGAIGDALGGIGAGVAAFLSLQIAQSVRAAELKRRKAEGMTLLRLITPEVSVLPMKLHRFLSDLKEARSWWSDPFAHQFGEAPKLLQITLDRLAQNPIPHAAAAVDRLAVLDDLGYGSIANDVSTVVAHVSNINDAATKAITDLEAGADDLHDTIEKLVGMVEFLRDLIAKLAIEMQPTIGMEPVDYPAMFTRT